MSEQINNKPTLVEINQKFADINGISIEEAERLIGAATEEEALKKIEEYTLQHIKKNMPYTMNRAQRRALAKKTGNKNLAAASAVAGTVLNIKPILKIADDGTLISIAKKRGLAKAASFLTELYEASADSTISNDVIIAHADCLPEAEAARDRVLAVNPDARIYICGLGPVIGAHTGPGMMALIHWGNRNYL